MIKMQRDVSRDFCNKPLVKKSMTPRAKERDHFPDEWDELEAEAAEWQASKSSPFHLCLPWGNKKVD